MTKEEIYELLGVFTGVVFGCYFLFGRNEKYSNIDTDSFAYADDKSEMSGTAGTSETLDNNMPMHNDDDLHRGKINRVNLGPKRGIPRYESFWKAYIRPGSKAHEKLMYDFYAVNHPGAEQPTDEQVYDFFDKVGGPLDERVKSIWATMHGIHNPKAAQAFWMGSNVAGSPEQQKLLYSFFYPTKSTNV